MPAGYATKYSITWADFFSQSGELLIKEAGYSGAISDIICRGNPVSIRNENNSDSKHSPVNGSYATITLVAETDFEYLDLYTLSPRKYFVEYSEGGTLFWSGFLLPSQYRETYKQPPYTNTFIASDQLGYLSTLTWDRDNVTDEFTTLSAILTKTDLDIDLYEGINVYEDGHSSTSADSPLDQTYIDEDAFYGLTYYDVLVNILTKYGAIIKQDKGAWTIHRVEELAQSFTRRYYTYSPATGFTYDSNASYDPVVETTSAPPATAFADIVRIANNGSMFLTPVWNKYTLTQDYGKVGNIVDNGDFLEWYGSAPSAWASSASVVRDGDRAKIFASATPGLALQQDISLTQAKYFKIRIEWEYFVKAGTTLDFTLDIIEAGAGTPSTNKFSFSANSWVYMLTPGLKREYDNSSGTEAITQGDSVEVVTNDNSLTGLFQISVLINEPDSSDTDNFVALKEVYIEPLEVLSATETKEYADDASEEVVIHPVATYDAGEVELLLSDLPDTVHNIEEDAKIVYRGGMWLDSGQASLTKNWTNAQGSGTLVELLREDYDRQYSQPTQVLNVTIYSKSISFTKVIKETNNGDRLFMIRRATYEPKFGRWQVEAHELHTGQLALQAEDGSDLLAEDGSTLLTQ